MGLHFENQVEKCLILGLKYGYFLSGLLKLSALKTTAGYSVQYMYALKSAAILFTYI